VSSLGKGGGKGEGTGGEEPWWEDVKPPIVPRRGREGKAETGKKAPNNGAIGKAGPKRKKWGATPEEKSYSSGLERNGSPEVALIRNCARRMNSQA